MLLQEQLTVGTVSRVSSSPGIGVHSHLCVLSWSEAWHRLFLTYISDLHSWISCHWQPLHISSFRNVASPSIPQSRRERCIVTQLFRKGAIYTGIKASSENRCVYWHRSCQQSSSSSHSNRKASTVPCDFIREIVQTYKLVSTAPSQILFRIYKMLVEFS